MRIRTIKPEFFTHEGLFEAEQDTGLPLRLAFIGLWCAADREGRFRWEPRRLGVQILPYDNIDFSRVLHALGTRGFIVRYRVGDACFGFIPSFQKHQVVNNREAGSILPDPEAESSEILRFPTENDASGTRGARVDHAGKAEGKGREGNMEGKGTDISTRRVDGSDVPGVDAAPVTADASTSKRYTEARVVLHALNEAAGRHYRETQANLDFIRARLSEPDVTVDGCIAMIRRQVARWGSDPKMAEFLRPETLFNRTKFDAYYAARDLPATAPETAGGRASVSAQRNAAHGPGIDAHIDESIRLSRAIDAEVERRMEDDPDFTPFGERKPGVPTEGVRHG